MAGIVTVPWPADPLRLPEPPRTVVLPDGDQLSVTVVPASGFVWDNWPSDAPERDEESK